MLPEIPELRPQQRYFLRGDTLNRIRERLIRQVPIAGNGVDVTEKNNGIEISVTGGTPTGTSALDFAASLSGSSVTVRAGKVLHTDWTAWDASDPACNGWTEEALTVSGSTMTVPSGDSVWLKLTIAFTPSNSIGPLSTTDTESVTAQAGGGGGGGAGGGGGGGGGDSPTGDGDDGAAGVAGAAGGGGLGGAGGGGGVGGGATPAGDGTPGGNGGQGEAGVPGVPVNFFNYQNALVWMVRYRVTAASYVVATIKPASSDLTAHLRICTRSGSSITQHQVGCVVMNLPVLSYQYS